MRYLIAIALLVFAGCDDDSKQWEAFRLAHHCRIIGYGKGGYTNASSGSIVFLPDTTTFACDDGVQYTRPRQ